MLRKLGIFEKAMLIANEHEPFNIVSVLRLENAPPPDIVKEALAVLQQRYPFLRVRIVKSGGQLVFEPLSPMQFPFEVVERSSPELWQDIAMQEMAFRFERNVGPLFRGRYVYKDGEGDLVLNIHHAIVDAASGMNLLDELLQICAGEGVNLPVLLPAAAPEDRFPAQYQGFWRILNTAGYFFSQMRDMLSYLWRTRGKRTPPVRLGGKGRIALLTLPEELVDSLSHLGRKKGVTLNSVLNAILLLAVNQHLYAGQPVIMRTFSFADLRPYTEPPTPKEYLANYVSMMGHTLEVLKGLDFWEFAGSLQAKIYRSLKMGDKFSALLMSASLLKIFTTLKSMRFGATALNYNGNVPLKSEYGDIKLAGFHGFVSGYDLGPEIASQARLFNDQIWWDFIYLDTDMDAETAQKITGEIMNILEKVVEETD